MALYNLGLSALKRLVLDENGYAYFRAKLSADLFKGEGEKEVFALIDGHFQKYKTLPDLSTVLVSHPDFAEVEAPEVAKFYIDLLENRFIYDQINRGNIASQDLLKADKNNIPQAIAELEKTLGLIKQQQYRTKILDFGLEGPDLILGTYYGTLGSTALSGGFGWPYMDDMCNGILGGDVVSIVGRPAMGKALPNDAKVLTLEGWKRNGHLKVGDKLASVDGRPSEVTGVYPQGKLKTYRVVFQDGRTTECSGDHLWEVWYRDWEAPKVLTTLQLIAKMEKSRYKKRLSVRLFSGDWGEDKQFPIDPYVLGALIGDGCFVSTDVRFSTEDAQMIHLMSAKLLRYQLKHVSGPDWRIISGGPNKLKASLEAMGLWGKKSHEKFVPEEYLAGSKAQRLELIQGLMDTDGTVEKTGSCTFCTTSPELAKQVQQLVWSLGGKSSLRTKKTAGRLSYIVGVSLEDRSDAFQMTRKKALAGPRTTHTNHRLTIVGVEEAGVVECQCISVSHPDKLYITDDYVVTHNTWFTLYIALHNWAGMKLNTLFVSMEMNTLAIAQRCASMYAHTNITQLKAGVASGYGSDNQKKFHSAMQALQMEQAKLYIVDGNLAADPTDVYLLAAQLDCQMIAIDGAYLMRNKNPRLGRFDRVAENMELMKRLTSENEQSTVASWQFNRDASKKMEKKGTKAGLEDIGYSDTIGQISTIALSLMQEEGVATLETRTVDVMKGRNGEIGQFDVNWDFASMDFSQVGATKKKKLDPLMYIE